jgi:hypothetical protein
MELALRDYNKFYNTKHGNRVLSWAHYLGTATLTSHFPKGYQRTLSITVPGDCPLAVQREDFMEGGGNPRSNWTE